MKEMISFEIDNGLKFKMDRVLATTGLKRSELLREGLRQAIHHYSDDKKDINEVEIRGFFSRIIQRLKN